jgi:chromosome segregation ATPase
MSTIYGEGYGADIRTDSQQTLANQITKAYREGHTDAMLSVNKEFKSIEAQRDEALAEVEHLNHCLCNQENVILAQASEIERHTQEVDASRDRIYKDEALLRECWDVMQSTSPYGLFYNKLKERLGETK